MLPVNRKICLIKSNCLRGLRPGDGLLRRRKGSVKVTQDDCHPNATEIVTSASIQGRESCITFPRRALRLRVIGCTSKIQNDTRAKG